MAEEVKPEVIKKTQTSLGKFIKKPPLTEKLLRKPPFRFLHDIISAVIKETGFLDNLFTEDELKPDIRDKEAKIAYLTKLITVVKLVTGVELTVRPAKIVSGQEPTKTNELLQAIAKALEKKISSAEAIEHYKASVEKGSRSSPQPNSPIDGQVKASVSKRSLQGRKPSEQREKVSKSTKASSDAGRTSRKERERPEGRKGEEREKREETIQDKAASATGKTQSVKKTKSVDETVIQTKDKGRNRRSSTVRSKQSAATRQEDDQFRPATTSASTEEKIEESVTQSIDHVDSIVDVSAEVAKIEETERIREPEMPEKSLNTKEVIVPFIQEPKVVKIQDPGNAPEVIKPSVPDQPVSIIKHSLRPPSSRPSSARPAAPKLRWKPEFSIKSHDLSVMENEAVIVENFDAQDDDKESMVVVETETEYSTAGDVPATFNADINQEHGYLVAQILETQRELANTTTVDLVPSKIDSELEGSSKKYREIVLKEVDKLRGTIQTLTRATNPMGKLLDCWQEDVELMQKELLDWRNQYTQVHNQLEIEKAASRESVKPMEESLNEINAAIKDQLDQIYQIKMNIMKNNHKIQQLLDGRA